MKCDSSLVKKIKDILNYINPETGEHVGSDGVEDMLVTYNKALEDLAKLRDLEGFDDLLAELEVIKTSKELENKEGGETETIYSGVKEYANILGSDIALLNRFLYTPNDYLQLFKATYINNDTEKFPLAKQEANIHAILSAYEKDADNNVKEVFVDGAAGSGKTTFVSGNAVKMRQESKGGKALITARYTEKAKDAHKSVSDVGVATGNLSGKTIQYIFDNKDKIEGDVDTIIIDEITLVDKKSYDKFKEDLVKYLKRDITFVLMGDTKQGKYSKEDGATLSIYSNEPGVSSVINEAPVRGVYMDQQFRTSVVPIVKASSVVQATLNKGVDYDVVNSKYNLGVLSSGKIRNDEKDSVKEHLVVGIEGTRDIVEYLNGKDIINRTVDYINAKNDSKNIKDEDKLTKIIMVGEAGDLMNTDFYEKVSKLKNVEIRIFKTYKQAQGSEPDFAFVSLDENVDKKTYEDLRALNTLITRAKYFTAVSLPGRFDYENTTVNGEYDFASNTVMINTAKSAKKAYIKAYENVIDIELKNNVNNKEEEKANTEENKEPVSEENKGNKEVDVKALKVEIAKFELNNLNDLVGFRKFFEGLDDDTKNEVIKVVRIKLNGVFKKGTKLSSFENTRAYLNNKEDYKLVSYMLDIKDNKVLDSDSINELKLLAKRHESLLDAEEKKMIDEYVRENIGGKKKTTKKKKNKKEKVIIDNDSDLKKTIEEEEEILAKADPSKVEIIEEGNPDFEPVQENTLEKYPVIELSKKSKEDGAEVLKRLEKEKGIVTGYFKARIDGFNEDGTEYYEYDKKVLKALFGNDIKDDNIINEYKNKDVLNVKNELRNSINQYFAQVNIDGKNIVVKLAKTRAGKFVVLNYYSNESEAIGHFKAKHPVGELFKINTEIREKLTAGRINSLPVEISTEKELKDFERENKNVVFSDPFILTMQGKWLRYNGMPIMIYTQGKMSKKELNDLRGNIVDILKKPKEMGMYHEKGHAIGIILLNQKATSLQNIYNDFVKLDRKDNKDISKVLRIKDLLMYKDNGFPLTAFFAALHKHFGIGQNSIVDGIIKKAKDYDFVKNLNNKTPEFIKVFEDAFSGDEAIKAKVFEILDKVFPQSRDVEYDSVKEKLTYEGVAFYKRGEDIENKTEGKYKKDITQFNLVKLFTEINKLTKDDDAINLILSIFDSSMKTTRSLNKGLYVSMPTIKEYKRKTADNNVKLSLVDPKTMTVRIQDIGLPSIMTDISSFDNTTKVNDKSSLIRKTTSNTTTQVNPIAKPQVVQTTKPVVNETSPLKIVKGTKSPKVVKTTPSKASDIETLSKVSNVSIDTINDIVNTIDSNGELSDEQEMIVVDLIPNIDKKSDLYSKLKDC